MYKKEDNIYVFDGDLEKYLLYIGVDPEHIKKMKEKILQSNKDNYYFIEEHNERIEMVPLDKVIGTSRGTVGDSVFDNVRMIPDGKREPTRFYYCFSFLEEMSLDELKESYKKLYYPVEMIYYEEDDEYYLSSDGNHRTLTAMLIGAKYIKARVYTKHCDFEKKDKYLAAKEFYNRYNICKIVQRYSNHYEIVFKEYNEYFMVSGFCTREATEDCYDLISRFSNEIENDKRETIFWLKFPEKIRNLIIKCCRNRRAFQYINKHIRTFDIYDNIIDLYDF